MAVSNFVGRVVLAVLTAGAHTGTKYISEDYRVRVTQRLRLGRIPARGNSEMIVTIGKPNFAERKFIARCKKAGEPFPVRKVQLKFPPRRKRS